MARKKNKTNKKTSSSGKNKKPTRFGAFIKKHRVVVIILSVVLVLFGSVAYGLYKAYTKPENLPEILKFIPKKHYYSPLTGIELKDEAATKKPVTAVMIENSPDARPQSGLKEANVVYEAIAEGGITRFLTLHQQDKPKLIGPVRSLRMYFVDWVAPYDASIAHVGGSYKALKEVRNGKYRDIDQFHNAGSYWRSSDRYAPHNVYTSSKRLDALNKKKGYKTSTFTGFERADGKPAETANATKIHINFSGAEFNTTYYYNKKKNDYGRSMAGKKHVDREKGQIRPSVVVAMHVNMRHVMEDGYRESIKTTGSGKVEIFQNGTVTKGTWKKDSRKAPLQFFDSDNKPIKLNRANQTWIAAVPNGGGGGVSWK